MQKTPEQHNVYKDVKRKDAVLWHIYWVYEDREFHKDIQKLINLETKVDDIKSAPITVTGKSKDLNIQIKDTQVKFDIQWDKMLDKYCISNQDLSEYYSSIGSSQESYKLLGPVYSAKIVQDHNPINNPALVVKFSHDLTYDEYIKAWAAIKYHLKQNNQITDRMQRVRAPDDTQLIYAIFKARKRKHTFKEIFMMYQKGLLPYYPNKPTNQFQSEDSLESYFQKYRPGKHQSFND